LAKKALILVPDLNKPGGVSNYFLALENKFDQWDYEYFTRGSRKHTPRPLIPLVILLDCLRLFFKLLLTRFDVVHLNISLGKRNLKRDPLYARIIQFFNVPLVLFIHGWDKSCEKSGDTSAVRTFLKSDAIIVLAEDFKNVIESWGYRKKIYVLPTVVSDDIKKASSDDLAKYNQSEKRILFLSRIEEEKGIYIVLEAFRLLKKKLPDVRLDYAGDGNDLSKLKSAVSDDEAGSIGFLGYISGQDKIQALQDAHLFFFPTYYGEGMPIAVLEAMMMGLPVVTRPVGGMKDLFSPEIGDLSDSMEPEYYAEKLYELLNDENRLKSIAKSNYDFAHEMFTVQKSVSTLEKIYNQTASNIKQDDH